MNTITPGTECPVCGKRHRADSAPLAVCSAELAKRATAKVAEAPKPEAQAPEVAPRATVPTNANGLRLLLAARKSRIQSDATEDARAVAYERQDHRARELAEAQGHAVIHSTTDAVKGTTAPWKRKGLGPWMTKPELIARYDAILISNVDRISRGNDEDFHYIEDWCYRNKKSIVVAQFGGFQFPPRQGAEGIVDKQLWGVFKDTARREWEAIRDRHADTREVIRKNGAAIGKAPFAYRITGAKLHKTFEIDPVTGPLAREAFQRMADGRTATSVAIWLTEATGQMWRVKRVLDMIKRRTYLGERDGHRFEPLVTEAVWNAANAAQESRSFKHANKGGRRAVHAYSGVIFCECGSVMHRHQSTRGKERYLCSKGRSGDVSETKCPYPSVLFADTNAAVDALMRADESWPFVTVTTGGDAARQAELAKIKADMNAAIAQGNMGTVATLAAEYARIDAMPAEPIVTKTTRRLDRSVGEVWAEATLADQRGMLGDRIITVSLKPDGSVQALDEMDAWTFPEEAEEA